MKLTDFKDEQALDLLADIIEPASEIFGDSEVKKQYNESKLKCVVYAIRNHKRAVLEILAAMDGIPVEEYHCNALTIPVKLLEILNDEELQQLFT